MKQLFKLFRYAKPYRLQFFLAVLFVIVETGFELFIPMVMADIIDVGLSTGDVGYIAEQGVVMAVMALISLVCGMLYARFAAIAANGFGGALRHAEFERIQQFSFLNIDHFETSSLITRMTNDVTVIQDAIATGLRPIVRGPAMLVLGLFFSFSINSELAMTFVVATPILGLILFFIVRKVAPMYKKLQEAIDKNDMATLKTKLDALEQAANAMAEAMYKQQQADPNAANGSTNAGSSNDDVVDADFSEKK